MNVSPKSNAGKTESTFKSIAYYIDGQSRRIVARCIKTFNAAATQTSILSLPSNEMTVLPKGFRNPIIPGFNPDPSMIHVGGYFYLVTSSFEYFPGCPIYRSRDLVNWELHGHAFSRRSQLDLRTCEAGAGIFAATIREHKGRVYVITCVVNRMDPSKGFGVSEVLFDLLYLKLNRTANTARCWAARRICVY